MWLATEVTPTLLRYPLVFPSLRGCYPDATSLITQAFMVHGRGELHLPPRNHELFLRCSLPDLGVDVHGEEGAGAVEDGGQGAHERGHHDWQHQAPQPWKRRRFWVGRTALQRFCARKVWGLKDSLPSEAMLCSPISLSRTTRYFKKYIVALNYIMSPQQSTKS